MSSNTPAAPAKSATPLAKRDVVPPEDAFWVRYSPHHEFPLSAVVSFTLHVVAVGLLLLIAFKLIYLFAKPVHPVPVEAVRFEGGGGGNPRGGEGGSGAPTRPQEVGPETQAQNTEPSTTNPADRPRLEPIKPDTVAEKFDVQSTRWITQVPRTNTAAFVRLGDAVRAKVGNLQEGSHGRGGDGSGGGKGSGRGTGEGSGQGPGQSKGTLTQREKRMLRWTMHFNTNTGRDYLNQLAGLGAILAIPVQETRSGPEFKIVRDLHRHPAQLLDEDISQIQRIYWIDDNPRNVADMMAALGVRLRPTHFVAFMPEKLEADLFEIEKANARGRPEEDIIETHFQVVNQGGRFTPVFQSIKLR
jgi:hypothetical protein